MPPKKCINRSHQVSKKKKEKSESKSAKRARSRSPSPTALPTGNPFDNVTGTEPEMIDPSITISGIGGLDKQIDYIRNNIVYPMLNRSAELNPLKAIIFHGPSGTGKTLLAKALVSEFANKGVKINFFKCNSEATSSSLIQLFRAAHNMKPSIICLDDLDKLCWTSDDPNLTATLLGQLEKVRRGDVVIIAATNCYDLLDPALKRVERFDGALKFDLPDEAGRTQILNILVSKWKSKPSTDLITKISKKTKGFYGSQLQDLTRAAYNKAMNQMDKVSLENSARCKTGITVVVTEKDFDAAISEMHDYSSYIQKAMDTLSAGGTYVQSVFSKFI